MFENSLKDFTSTVNAYRLRAAADELARVKTRLTQLENRHAEQKEARQHDLYMQQQAKMERMQANIRANLNNRWAR